MMLWLTGTALAQFAGPSPAHTQAGRAAEVIRVKNVSIEQSDDGVAVVIASNGALVPAITKLDGPPRLVIDLPGAVNASLRSRLQGTRDEIKSLRVSQYQLKPPLTRVVVDLSEARDYSWETVEDRLLVHLRRPDKATNIESDKSPAFTSGGEAPITYAAAPPAGSVQHVVEQTSGPSSVTATDTTTVLNLARGGQIRVCPGTTVSVTSSNDRRDVMVGMSTGSFEAHYSLNDSADSVLTPDFRILLAGPGEFHLAMSADSRGNTCVRGLAGNRSPVLVSELMGNGTYQVKPGEQVVFHSGQLGKVDHDAPIDCGCPQAQAPVLRAEVPPMSLPANQASPPTEPPAAGIPLESNPSDSAGVKVTMSVRASDQGVTAPIAASHAPIQVDTPLVFRASDPLPVPTAETKKLPVVSVPPQALALAPLPPKTGASSASRTAKPRPGFFGRFKRLLSSVFG